jgi:hypothetical protein
MLGMNRPHILRHYPRIQSDELKTHKNLNQDSRSQFRELNPGHPECEGDVSTQPWRVVWYRYRLKGNGDIPEVVARWRWQSTNWQGWAADEMKGLYWVASGKVKRFPGGRGHLSTTSIIRAINRNFDDRRYDQNRYPTTLNLQKLGATEENKLLGKRIISIYWKNIWIEKIEKIIDLLLLYTSQHR